MRKILCCFAWLLLAPVLPAANLVEENGTVVVAHPDFELRLYPGDGGRGELKLKGGGLYAAGNEPQALFQERFSEAAMEKAPAKSAFACRTEETGSVVKVVLSRTLTAAEASADLADVELIRTVMVDQTKPGIEVEVSLKNPTKENRHAAFGVMHRYRIEKFSDGLTYVPTTQGVLEKAKNGTVWSYYSGGDKWDYHPVAGWLAVNDPKTKNGAGFVFDYDLLEAVYIHGDQSAMGWLYDGGFLPPGGVFHTRYRLLPFEGLESVSFLSDDIVVGLTPPTKGGRDIPVGAFSFRPGELHLTVRTVGSGENPREMSLGEWKAAVEPGAPVSKILSYPSVPASACAMIVEGSFGQTPFIIHQHAENGFSSQSIPWLPLNIAPLVAPPAKQRQGAELIAHDSIRREKKAFIFFGIYTEHYALDKVFKGWQVDISDAPPARAKLIPPASTIDSYAMIVMSDINAGCLPASAIRRLAGYVKRGGALLVLGGPYAYGQGDYQNSELAEWLPVECDYFDLQPEPEGRPIVSTLPGLELSDPLMLYWRHRCPVKPGSEVWMTAGDQPVLVTGMYGDGRVACLLTGPLGKAAEGETAFWESPEWIRVMTRVVTRMREGQQQEDHP